LVPFKREENLVNKASVPAFGGLKRDNVTDSRYIVVACFRCEDFEPIWRNQPVVLPDFDILPIPYPPTASFFDDL
jgi:hypothetical protein